MATKAPSKLSAKECLDELAILGKDVEFDRNWDENTPVAELRALVKEGREAMRAGADDNAGAPPAGETGTPPTDGTGAPPATNDANTGAADTNTQGDANTGASTPPANTGRPVRATEKTEVIVRLKDGTRRLYSERSHGPQWMILATNYKEHHRGVFE